jgi:hypothetical protein
MLVDDRDVVAVDVAVATEADVVVEIAMIVDLISPLKQLKIAGTTQNPMTAGTTIPTIRLITIRTIESRHLSQMIARNVRAGVVAAEVADAIAMKDKETINAVGKRSRPVTAMTRGATQVAIAMTIAAVMMGHTMTPIGQAEAKEVVEVAIVAHVEKATDVMIVQRVPNVPLALRATIAVAAVTVEEAIARSRMIVLNVQDAVVAVVADNADRMIRFQPFHDTVKYRLGTTRSQVSFHRTSRATAVDQETARAVDVDDQVLVPAEAETQDPETTQVLAAAETTAQGLIGAEMTTLAPTEAEATILVPSGAEQAIRQAAEEEITPVLTEAAIRALAEEIPEAEVPAAIAAKVGSLVRLIPTCLTFEIA